MKYCLTIEDTENGIIMDLIPCNPNNENINECASTIVMQGVVEFLDGVVSRVKEMIPGASVDVKVVSKPSISNDDIMNLDDLKFPD